VESKRYTSLHDGDLLGYINEASRITKGRTRKDAASLKEGML
jgi:hypothetical protein